MLLSWTVILITVFTTGCSMIPEKTSVLQPAFFSCNYWVDRNQNNLIDEGEWDGIKDDFKTTEHICFVGYFRHKQGTNLTFKLFIPDGSLYREKTLKQTSKVSVWCQEYEAKDLVNSCSPGIWRVEWYVERQLVNITVIRIIP